MLSDVISADIDAVFFNQMDFASEHTFNGSKILCIVDSDALNRRTAQAVFNDIGGVGRSEISVFVKTADIAKKIAVGNTVIFDNKHYVVNNFYESGGVTEMILEQNRNI